MIPDDLIVQGSACIGFDCINGESFGFDTIRLKENNLRIKAQDTSSSASFPSNDWQITFNDSANGGANKFSIDDIDGGRTPFTIEAGAPSHSLYVDDGGRIGIGTSTPVVDVHDKSGNTPTLRLEQDGSSGFTPQTWDVAGNEANFFIRDATNGSTLPFRIVPGAPTSSIHINVAGVGVGTENPLDRLHVANGTLRVEATDGTTPALRFATADQSWLFENSVENGIFTIRDETVGAAPFRVFPGGQANTLVLANGRVGVGTSSPDAKLDVSGPIIQRGGLLQADYVFEPGYELESIEDHAAFMWRERHLPSVPATDIDASGEEVVEIGAQRRGILEELEKAHIYIERLNESLRDKEGRIEGLENENAAILDRLQRVESLLSALEAGTEK